MLSGQETDQTYSTAPGARSGKSTQVWEAEYSMNILPASDAATEQLQFASPEWRDFSGQLHHVSSTSNEPLLYNYTSLIFCI